jgi:arsenite oxidase small subunit
MVNRRSFVKLCASAVAMITSSPSLLARPNSTVHSYQRVKLVDTLDRPIDAAKLKEGESYLFHYPYISTPCFLLNLGKPTAQETLLRTKDGASYIWPGGVGPQRSIVAFSAICAHKMTHPARSVSFINYRPKRVSFLDAQKKVIERDHVIYCCSEKSVYDPTKGAQVLGGPAPQPLATILLEYNEQDGSLEAIGTDGGDMFEKFLSTFDFRLKLEYRTDNIRKQVAGMSTVTTVAEYCRTQVMC